MGRRVGAGEMTAARLAPVDTRAERAVGGAGVAAAFVELEVGHISSQRHTPTRPRPLPQLSCCRCDVPGCGRSTVQCGGLD